jgi:hypothetical protein
MSNNNELQNIDFNSSVQDNFDRGFSNPNVITYTEEEVKELIVKALTSIMKWSNDYSKGIIDYTFNPVKWFNKHKKQ